MSSNKTSNINLHSWTGSDYVKRQEFNDNFTIIDTEIDGAKDRLATIEGVNAGTRIAVNEADLANATRKTLQLAQGAQVVTVERDAPFNVLNITGRTLVNRMMRLGNLEPETITAYARITTATIYSQVGALDSTDYVQGKNSFKITVPSGYTSDGIYKMLGTDLPTGKYYVLAADVKNVDGNFIHIRHSNGTNRRQSANVTSTNWTTAFVGIRPDEVGAATNSIEVAVDGTGKSGKVDGIRIYEITQAEYNALATMTPEQVAAKYPYVDDMKSIDRVHITKRGENGSPGFVDWTMDSASYTHTGPYSTILNANGSFQHLWVAVPVVPGQKYTISANHSGRLGVRRDSKDGAAIAIIDRGAIKENTVLNMTIPADVNIVYLRVDSTAAGTFTFENIMFNVGDTALPFKPREDNALYLWNMNAGSDPTGTVFDTVDVVNKRITRRISKPIELTSDMAWTYNSDQAGYKYVTTPAGNKPIDRKIQTVKYDGKILVSDPAISGADHAFFNVGLDTIFVAVADTDSGWGEAYSPTADEIKVYFNGWKMSATNSGAPTLYTGTGNKYWLAVTDTTGGAGAYTAANDINFVVNTPINNVAGLKRYRLQYQLAQSVPENINSEGAIALHEGANQLEMGTGIVVREKFTPGKDTTYDLYWINNQYTAVSKLKNRAALILGVYRNGAPDKRWELRPNDSGAYGKADGTLSYSVNYDPSSVYEVTYLALDTYVLGIAPQTLQAEYTPNIRETVDELAKRDALQELRLSVLEAGKAQKNSPNWIDVTGFLNGWLSYGINGQNPAFYKDENNTVYFRGQVKSGTVTAGTTIFQMPRGYRHNTGTLWFPVFSTDTQTGEAAQRIGLGYLNADGAVRLYSTLTYNNLVILQIPPYKAEQ